jgi:hypothetical protein
MAGEVGGDFFCAFGEVVGDGVGDDFVVGDEDDVGGAEALAFEEEFGGVFVVDDDVEEFAAGDGFESFDELGVLELEELEDSAFDLFAVEVGFGVTVLGVREKRGVTLRRKAGLLTSISLTWLL